MQIGRFSDELYAHILVVYAEALRVISKKYPIQFAPELLTRTRYNVNVNLAGVQYVGGQEQARRPGGFALISTTKIRFIFRDSGEVFHEYDVELAGTASDRAVVTELLALLHVDDPQMHLDS